MLKITFRFIGKCRLHPRYNPKEDGQPRNSNCPGCETLRVIHLYTSIAANRAKAADGILTAYRTPPQGETEQSLKSQDRHERADLSGFKEHGSDELTPEERDI